MPRAAGVPRVDAGLILTLTLAPTPNSSTTPAPTQAFLESTPGVNHLENSPSTSVGVQRIVQVGT